MQERFYFGDNVLPLFETGIPLLKQRLRELPDADNVSKEYNAGKLSYNPLCLCLLHCPWFNPAKLQVVVAFPDDGAWKRFHKQLDGYPVVSWNLFKYQYVVYEYFSQHSKIGCQLMAGHLYKSSRRRQKDSADQGRTSCWSSCCYCWWFGTVWRNLDWVPGIPLGPTPATYICKP